MKKYCRPSAHEMINILIKAESKVQMCKTKEDKNAHTRTLREVRYDYTRKDIIP